jgi:hypothetical protein
MAKKVERKKVPVLISVSRHMEQKDVVAVFDSEEDLQYFLKENPVYNKGTETYTYRVEFREFFKGVK